MRRLNRKEFKELLTEWNSNFINERGEHQDLFANPDETFLAAIKDKNLNVIEGLLNFLNDKLNTGFVKYGLNLLYKNEENIRLINEYFIEKGYEKEANDIIREQNNISPLFIMYNAHRSVVVDGSRQGDYRSQDITWILHDFIHSFIENKWFMLQDDFVFQDDSLMNSIISMGKEKLGPYEAHDLSFGLNKYDGHDYHEEGLKEYILIKALEKFFNTTNFTPGVGGVDSATSAYAYCWMKMKHEKDFEEIDSCFSLNEEEKNIIKDYLKSMFSTAIKVKNDLLKVFNNTILIICVML